MSDEPFSADGSLARIRTGSAELDAILGGGLPANSINIVMGEPGSGKTILAERLVFANAEHGGRRILYLTTMSEPLEKVVRYLQGFTFFDESLLTEGVVVYDSLGTELQELGIGALVPRLREAIRTLTPKIIVIDSFKAIHDLSTSIPDMRRMLFEMAGLLSAYETTVLLVGEYSEHMISELPEFAVADAMIELARKKQSTRDERYLRVLKLRGSAYQEGLHAFRLGRGGLEVFPRLTSPKIPVAYESGPEERVGTGVVGLDGMLRGGLFRGTTTLVFGPTGSGKTTLALQFVLEGLRRGEPVLYVNFQENPTRLARNIGDLGWSLDDARSKGLELMYWSPVELQADTILVEMFRVIEQKNIRRIAIDAVGDLVNVATDRQRVLGYIYALCQHFQVRGVTSLITYEIALNDENAVKSHMSAMSDALVSLALERVGDRTRRTLQVVKARGTDHDLDVREFHIGAAGAVVS